MRADLHLHTYYSDGAEAPAAVVERAAASGLDLVAIADHDSMGAWVEAEVASQRTGVRLLPAAEFTAYEGGTEIHLLGYFPAPPGPAVQEHLRRVQALRRQRLETAIARLQKRGVQVEFSRLPCAPACESVTASHLALLLVQNGYARSMRAVWGRYLNNGVVPAFPVMPKEVIAVIHAGDGLAVWAHPSRRGFLRRLEELVALGLDGVEVANGRRGQQRVREWQAEALKHNLVMTGGSDWHGEGKLGEFAVGEELVGELLRRLGW